MSENNDHATDESSVRSKIRKLKLFMLILAFVISLLIAMFGLNDDVAFGGRIVVTLILTPAATLILFMQFLLNFPAQYVASKVLNVPKKELLEKYMANIY
jgi:hypothetical protein